MADERTDEGSTGGADGGPATDDGESASDEDDEEGGRFDKVLDVLLELADLV